MVPRCTWDGCEADGVHPWKDKDGIIWASLCDKHNTEFDKVTNSKRKDFSIADVVRCWIAAQGGAIAAARRLAG